MPIRIGTRKSPLALWQTHAIRELLQQYHPHLPIEIVAIITQGDRILDKPLPEIGGKGLFTSELESALARGEIDLAVHSLKDLPTQLDPAFTVGAIPPRANPFDTLVNRDHLHLDDLPRNAILATSSLRRAAQLKAYRRDFQVQPIRGNVETRLHKIFDPQGPYTAGILAAAGLARLGLLSAQMQVLPPQLMLPAPAQGAIGVQCRADDRQVLAWLAPLDDPQTRACVGAERAFLRHLEAGCSLPLAAYATTTNAKLQLTGRIDRLDGTQTLSITREGEVSQSERLGIEVANEILAKGGGSLLKDFQS